MESMESAGSGTSRSLPLRRPCLVLTVGLVLAAAAGCSSGSSSDASNGWNSGGSSGATAAASGAGNDLQTDYQNTVKAVLPSVVQITTNSDLGSGVIYDKRGDIVTNAHVVGKATTFQVSLATGGKRVMQRQAEP